MKFRETCNHRERKPRLYLQNVEYHFQGSSTIFNASIAASISTKHIYKTYTYMCIHNTIRRRGGELGSSTIFKNLMSPTPHRKWYLTTGRRAH